jgi:LmbE family N-acetylglucosaminyl deacetylase
MFEKSIIVAAHPDDEVLWFSSILDQINEVIICCLENKSKPDYSNGRKKSLLEHPIKNICCLGINETGVFRTADWNNPVITRFGIQILKKDFLLTEYEGNYHKLKEKLENKLNGYHNVFTHNPWGEYGHEEHVQIYRVVKELQGEKKFNLWFSNYCSNSSFNLMLNYISGFDSEYVTLKTNKILANTVKDIYIKNRAWTWYDDWEWFNEESFMKDKNHTDRVKTYGHIFPLNMIKFDPFVEVQRNSRSNSKQVSLHNFFIETIKHAFKKHEKNN